MDGDTWLTEKNFSIPNLGRGPPGRGPWPTRQRSAAHQWAAAHRLRTAALGSQRTLLDKVDKETANGGENKFMNIYEVLKAVGFGNMRTGLISIITIFDMYASLIK